MKVIAVRLEIPDEPTMIGSTRNNLENFYRNKNCLVETIKVQKLWKGSIPPGAKLNISRGNAVITIIDNWECEIFGKSLRDCFSAFAIIHSELADILNKAIPFKIILPYKEEAKLLDTLLDEERRRDIGFKILWVLFAAACGVGVTKLIEYIASGIYN